MRNPLRYRSFPLGLGCVPVHLGGIEHRVTTREQKARTVCSLLPIVLRFAGLVGKLPEDNEGRLFPLPDLCAAILPLLVRRPFAGLVALGLRSGPETDGI